MTRPAVPDVRGMDRLSHEIRRVRVAQSVVKRRGGQPPIQLGCWKLQRMTPGADEIADPANVLAAHLGALGPVGKPPIPGGSI